MCILCVSAALTACLTGICICHGRVYFVQLCFCICFSVFHGMTIDKFCESVDAPVLISL